MINHKAIGLSKHRVEMMDFALDFAAGLDMINRSEDRMEVIQGVIVESLRKLGYKDVDAYSAGVALEPMLRPLGGVVGAYNLENNAVTLLGLISTAAKMIEDKRIPKEIRDHLAEHLSAKK